MEAEQEYTNGRIRVRPDQIEYLDQLLHRTWVQVARERAKVRDLSTSDAALVTLMNRELRLLKSLQDEVRRTRGDMGLV